MVVDPAEKLIALIVGVVDDDDAVRRLKVFRLMDACREINATESKARTPSPTVDDQNRNDHRAPGFVPL